MYSLELFLLELGQRLVVVGRLLVKLHVLVSLFDLFVQLHVLVGLLVVQLVIEYDVLVERLVSVSLSGCLPGVASSPMAGTAARGARSVLEVREHAPQWPVPQAGRAVAW